MTATAVPTPSVVNALEAMFDELGPLHRPVYPHFTWMAHREGRMRFAAHDQRIVRALWQVEKQANGSLSWSLAYVMHLPTGGTQQGGFQGTHATGASWNVALEDVQGVFSRRLLLECVALQRSFQCRFAVERPPWLAAFVGDMEK